jgi:hypothetical protein
MVNYTKAAMRWINANAVAMHMFFTYAMRAKNSGCKKMGIRLLIERTRWYGVVERPGIDFKIPNSYAATISRELMRRHFDLAGFFTTNPERCKPMSRATINTTPKATP